MDVIKWYVFDFVHLFTLVRERYCRTVLYEKKDVAASQRLSDRLSSFHHMDVLHRLM